MENYLKSTSNMRYFDSNNSRYEQWQLLLLNSLIISAKLQKL